MNKINFPNNSFYDNWRLESNSIDGRYIEDLLFRKIHSEPEFVKILVDEFYQENDKEEGYIRIKNNTYGRLFIDMLLKEM